MAASHAEVIIVGGGLAGLSCALALEEGGIQVGLLEAADAPGGRIRTDVVEGFRLDRGFQILLTAYPDAKRLLNYDELNLRSFARGALVRHGGRFHRFADPFRSPLDALPMLFDNVIPLGDKLRVAKLRAAVREKSLEAIFSERETAARNRMREFGFSDAMLERFLGPFFSGIFLENELVTSSRFFEFLFRMFSLGDSALPEAGMEAIPRQLASRLPPGTLRTNMRVRRITRTAVSFEIELPHGEIVSAQAVVLATAAGEGKALLSGVGGWSVPEIEGWNKATTFYYAAGRVSVKELLLMLNGEGKAAGPVNNAAVLSAVAPGYAPPGAELIAATVVGEAPGDCGRLAAMDASVRQHLTQWFGAEASRWKMLAAYPIARALPLQRHVEWEQTPVRLVGSSGVYMCGDFRETASIQGALASGRRAAAAVLKDFGKSAAV